MGLLFSYGARLNVESVHRLRRILSVSAPTVFDGIEQVYAVNFLTGARYYTGIDEISIGNPGPIVVDSVIFFRNTPLEEDGLALRKSDNNAAIFSMMSSDVKSIFPTVQ